MTEQRKSVEALPDLRVLDVSESIAGQFCARMLADYGAEVLLIEPPEGSMTRSLPPFRAVSGQPADSLVFHHNNVGKKSIVIDREEAAGRDQFLALTTTADVIVLPAGADHATLREANPHVILCVVAPFGDGTPKSHWRGSEIVYQAMSGMMNNNGRASQPPLYGVGHRASYCAGVAAYISVISALYLRAREGIAQDVAIDVAHTAAAMCFPFTLQHSYNGSLETRGQRNQPLLEIKCADVWISIWIRANHFPIICEVLGTPDLVEDPRFLTDNLRQDNLQALVAELQQRIGHRNGRDLVEALSARRMVAACAYLPSQLGADAPHLKARDYWQQGMAPGDPPVPGPQFRLSLTPRTRRDAAPTLQEAANV